MRGAGKGISLALLAACAVAAFGIAAPAGADRAPLTSSLQSARPVGLASASANTNIFVLWGTSSANNVSAFADAGGRLVLTSPEGIVEPDGPAPECIQDSPTQVSCVPSYIGAIRGDLGAGNDRFRAIAFPIPISVAGGTGNDDIGTSGGPDVLAGGPDDDILRGNSGIDDYFGEGGNDVIRPGTDPDDIAARLDPALARLASTGATVVLFTGVDVGFSPVFRRIRGKVAIYNELLRGLAASSGVVSSAEA